MLAIFLTAALIFSLTILVMVVTEMLVFVRTRVPFVPTSKRDIERIVKRLPITKDDYVYDLGSGNGRVVFAIEKLSGAHVKGFQLMGWTHWYARLSKKLVGSKAELHGTNFFKHNWGEATVIYAYLYPFLMSQVGAKAALDCRVGTRIIARDFPIPNLTLHERWDMGNNHEIFVYII